MSQTPTPEQELIEKIFLPKPRQDIEAYKKTGKRFVHYTTAENALKIIHGQEAWFRNTAVMNDFSEVRHGISCLVKAYESEAGKKLRAALDECHTGISTEIEKIFNEGIRGLSTNTFIFCLSEHEDEEDEFGRLSMWRAYGPTAGVALVFNPEPFYQESDGSAAFMLKVDYSDHVLFEKHLDDIADRVRSNLEAVRAADKNYLKQMMSIAFKFYATCLKHPGFKEEKEWRVIYMPDVQESKHLNFSAETIKGIPQIVGKFPLQDNADIGLVGVDIGTLIEKIIIGPCEAANTIAQTFVAELSELGIANAGSRVRISNIPLRT